MEPLTRDEKRALEVIVAHVRSENEAPTYKDLERLLGVKAPAVKNRLDGLERKRRITLFGGPGRARKIRIRYDAEGNRFFYGDLMTGERLTVLDACIRYVRGGRKGNMMAMVPIPGSMVHKHLERLDELGFIDYEGGRVLRVRRYPDGRPFDADPS